MSVVRRLLQEVSFFYDFGPLKRMMFFPPAILLDEELCGTCLFICRGSSQETTGSLDGNGDEGEEKDERRMGGV